MTHRNWLTTGVICAAIAFVVATGAFFDSQQPPSADSRAMILAVDRQPLVAVTKGGERSFSVEIADTSAEHEAGLMFREEMADDHGMLFVFEEARDVSFWMKNTPMPLDLIFVGQDGRIRSIKQGEPQSEAMISPGEPVRFVLELKAGTAARGGIEDGDLLRHPASALRTTERAGSVADAVRRGSVAEPSRHRTRPCHGLFDGRADGLNVHKGKITNRAVAEALGYEMAEPKTALAA